MSGPPSNEGERQLAPLESYNTHVTVTNPALQGRIVALLDHHPDGRAGLAVSQIGEALAVKVGPSLRMALSRCFKSGRIRRLDTGLYASASSFVNPPTLDPRVRFHGIQAYTLLQNGDRGDFRRVSQRVTSLTDPLRIFRNQKSKTVECCGEWGGRPWTVTLAETTGRVSVWLRASNVPLHLIEVNTFMDGVVPTLTDLPPELWRFDQLGVNFDLPGAKVNVPWQMTFDHGISIAGFNRLFVQVYDKLVLESGRVDLHLSVPDPGGLPADFVTGLMRRLMESVEIIAAEGRPNADRGVRP